MIIINALKIELVIEPTSLGSILITLIVTMQILALALMVVVGRSHAWMHNSTANMTLHSRLVVLFIWQTGQTKANLAHAICYQIPTYHNSYHIICYHLTFHSSIFTLLDVQIQMQAHICTHYSLLSFHFNLSLGCCIYILYYCVSLLFPPNWRFLLQSATFILFDFVTFLHSTCYSPLTCLSQNERVGCIYYVS